MTEEERKKHNDYCRKWRRENPEKVKKNMQKFRETHPDYFTKYYKAYYQDNREYRLKMQAKWRECNTKMDTVYLFIDEDGQVIYIGSSSRFKERISAHCTANSNLKMSAEEMVEKYNLAKIIYKDFTQYNLSREDLYFIESYFKENMKEIIKTNAVHYKEEKLTRSKEELIDIAMNQVEYVEFEKMDRYLN